MFWTKISPPCKPFLFSTTFYEELTMRQLFEKSLIYFLVLKKNESFSTPVVYLIDCKMCNMVAVEGCFKRRALRIC